MPIQKTIKNFNLRIVLTIIITMAIVLDEMEPTLIELKSLLEGFKSQSRVRSAKTYSWEFSKGSLFFLLLSEVKTGILARYYEKFGKLKTKNK